MAPIKRKGEPSNPVERSGKKQKLAKTSLSKVSFLKEEEPSFPRGGASVLTPLEHKQIQIKAKQDVLFEQSTGKKAQAAFDSEDDNDEANHMTAIDTLPPNARRRKPKLMSANRKETETVEKEYLRIEGLSFKVLVLFNRQRCYFITLTNCSVLSQGQWCWVKLLKSTNTIWLLVFQITLQVLYL
jgi:rRNA biogenesis protein RRP5